MNARARRFASHVSNAWSPLAARLRGRLAFYAVLALGVELARPAFAAEEGGLVLAPDPILLLVLMAGFVALVFPLNALLFQPILKALAARDERIAGTRARAEKLARETESVLERYESAIREARESAERARRSRLDEARAGLLEATTTSRAAAERELERARAELGATLDEARTSLRGEANELARAAAARVLGRAI